MMMCTKGFASETHAHAIVWQFGGGLSHGLSGWAMSIEADGLLRLAISAEEEPRV